MKKCNLENIKNINTKQMFNEYSLIHVDVLTGNKSVKDLNTTQLSQLCFALPLILHTFKKIKDLKDKK